MPTYNFTNKKTGKKSSSFMTIASMEKYLEDNPNITLDVSCPAYVDPYSVGRVKAPKDFQQLLKKIKKANRGSTIQTGNLGEI